MMRQMAILFAVLALVPSAALAQIRTETELQIGEDEQAARDRQEQAAQAEAAQRNAEASRQRADANASGDNSYQRVVVAHALKRWVFGHWMVSAEQNSVCRAFFQFNTVTPAFWGFRQTGPKIDNLELFFSSNGPARPQTLQMAFNDAGHFAHDATVETFAGFDTYVISLRGVTIASFPNVTDFEAFSGDTRIWSEREFNMGKVEEAMVKCWEWQIDHG